MIEDYFFTKNTRWFLWGGLALLAALLIFHAGFVTGQHQNKRGHMGTGGPDAEGGGMLLGLMPRQGFVEDGHGAVGTIATVTLPTFTLQSRDGMVQTIFAGTSTVVTGGSATDTSALSHGEMVIVIGDPTDTDDTGYLDARIIHILPRPPAQ